ncbi:HAMP domain-containing histidine kinase, partial [bacterium]|nr:HAMP domain-containing histidine kinase [bacterium]
TEVDRLKTEFLSHAAHELRTPMTSIMGFSELLLERELDAPTQRDILETINRRSIQLVDIINELLDIARIEARRKQDLTIIEVDLASLAHDTVVDMGVLNERCRIVLDLPPGAIYAFADIDKLRRALTNIIG